ncbi:MAG: TIR domain-containing protein [Caldilineaceae bacterium]|nr:TIR domain-containing protein [Caldilineaceae bacterium]
MDQSRHFHIFISHHTDDLDFVETELLPRLADAGLTAATGEDLRAGTNRLDEMARLVRESHHTLALVTPNWLADGLLDFQRQIGQHSDPNASRRRFIPLLLGVRDLPPALAHLTPLDLNDPAQRARRLASLLTELSRPAAPPALDPLSLYTPPQPATLYGRDEFIAQLAGELTGELIGPASHTPLALTALGGLPGVGKTALALGLAQHPAVTAAFPDGIFWVALGPQMNDDTLLAEMARFIAALGGSAQGLTTAEQHSRALADLLAGRRALLLLDDCWNPAHARPFRDALPPTARCLLTTRRSGVADDLGAAQRLVDVLRPDPSLELLAAGGDLAGQAVAAHPETAAALADRLGHLPLALEVAARYLQKLARADGPAHALAHLLAELAEEEGRLLRLTAAQRRLGLDADNPSLEAVLGLSYAALSDDEQDAFVRLAVCGAQPLSFEAGAMAALWDAGQAATRLSLRSSEVSTSSTHRPVEGSKPPDSPLPASRHNQRRAGLVDAGLLTPNRDRDDPGSDTPRRDTPRRYSLHQTVAAYALARLTESGQRRAMELAHAAYYQAIVANYEEWITEGRMNYAAPAEWEGVSLAIERLAAAQATDVEAARLLIRYSHHWRNVLYNNHDPRRGDWLAAAVAAAQRMGDSWDQANVLKAQGDVLSFQDKRDEALEKYEGALGLFQAVGALGWGGRPCFAQGDVLSFQDKRDEALEKYEKGRWPAEAQWRSAGGGECAVSTGDLSFQDKRDRGVGEVRGGVGPFPSGGRSAGGGECASGPGGRTLVSGQADEALEVRGGVGAVPSGGRSAGGGECAVSTGDILVSRTSGTRALEVRGRRAVPSGGRSAGGGECASGPGGRTLVSGQAGRGVGEVRGGVGAVPSGGRSWWAAEGPLGDVLRFRTSGTRRWRSTRGRWGCSKRWALGWGRRMC